MPDNRYDQSQPPGQVQTAPVQENVDTSVTVTTDRTLQGQSAAQLQNLEETIRRDDYRLGF
jgi:hypothetical protein